MEALKVSRQIGHQSDDLDRGKQGMKEDINGIERQMKAGFAAVDKRFDKVDARFDKVEGEMKAGFKAVADRFEKTPTRDEMTEGFEKAGQQLERVAQSLGEQMNKGFAGLKEQTEARMDRIEGRRAKFQGGIWGIVGAAAGSVVTAVVTHFS